jgi:hypothetical protein
MTLDDSLSAISSQDLIEQRVLKSVEVSFIVDTLGYITL